MTRAETFVVAIPTNSPFRLRRCVHTLFRNDPTLRGRTYAYYDEAAFRGSTRVDDVRYVAQLPEFVLAREWNRALTAHPLADVVLLADDATCPDGQEPVFAACAQVAEVVAGRALVHPSVSGDCFNNPTLPYGGTHAVKRNAKMLAMICAYLPVELRALVGLPDEHLRGYGAEDHDYCYRVRRAGLPLLCPDWVRAHHEPLTGAWRTKLGPTIDFEPAAAQLTRKWGSYPLPVVPYPDDL